MFSKPSFYVALQGLSQKIQSPSHKSGNFTEGTTVTSKQKTEDCMSFLKHYLRLTRSSRYTTAQTLLIFNTTQCNRQAVNNTFANISRYVEFWQNFARGVQKNIKDVVMRLLLYCKNNNNIRFFRFRLQSLFLIVTDMLNTRQRERRVCQTFFSAVVADKSSAKRRQILDQIHNYT